MAVEAHVHLWMLLHATFLVVLDVGFARHVNVYGDEILPLKPVVIAVVVVCSASAYPPITAVSSWIFSKNDRDAFPIMLVPSFEISYT